MGLWLQKPVERRCTEGSSLTVALSDVGRNSGNKAAADCRSSISKTLCNVAVGQKLRDRGGKFESPIPFQLFLKFDRLGNVVVRNHFQSNYLWRVTLQERGMYCGELSAWCTTCPQQFLTSRNAPDRGGYPDSALTSETRTICSNYTSMFTLWLC